MSMTKLTPARCTERHGVGGSGASLSLESGPRRGLQGCSFSDACSPAQTEPDVPRNTGQLLQGAESGLVGSLNVIPDAQASQGLQHATPNCCRLCSLCCLPPVASHKARTPGRDPQAGLQQPPAGCQGLQPFPCQAAQAGQVQPPARGIATLAMPASPRSGCHSQCRLILFTGRPLS